MSGYGDAFSDQFEPPGADVVMTDPINPAPVSIPIEAPAAIRPDAPIAEVIESPPHVLLVLRGDGWTDGVLVALSRVIAPNVLAVRLNWNDQIEALDEDAMRQHGWVRLQTGGTVNADDAYEVGE